MKHTKSIIIAFALSVSVFAQSAFYHATATFTSDSGTAYTSGDSVGVAQTLTNVISGSATGRIITLDGFTLKDSANQKKSGYLLFFDTSAPTLTNNAAFAWGSSIGNLVGVLDISAADYVTFDSKGVASRTFVGLRMRLSASTPNLYVAFVTTDTPTYGNGGTLSFDFHFSN